MTLPPLSFIIFVIVFTALVFSPWLIGRVLDALDRLQPPPQSHDPATDYALMQTIVIEAL